MMVPGQRLVGWTGLGVVPFATLAALVPEVWAWCVVPISGMVLAAVWDGWRGHRAQRGLRVELPECVRLFVGRPGRVEVALTGFDRAVCRVRVGVAWPPSIEPERRELDVDLPVGADRVRVAVGCTGWQL